MRVSPRASSRAAASADSSGAVAAARLAEPRHFALAGATLLRELRLESEPPRVVASVARGRRRVLGVLGVLGAEGAAARAPRAPGLLGRLRRLADPRVPRFARVKPRLHLRDLRAPRARGGGGGGDFFVRFGVARRVVRQRAQRRRPARDAPLAAHLPGERLENHDFLCFCRVRRLRRGRALGFASRVEGRVSGRARRRLRALGEQDAEHLASARLVHRLDAEARVGDFSVEIETTGGAYARHQRARLSLRRGVALQPVRRHAPAAEPPRGLPGMFILADDGGPASGLAPSPPRLAGGRERARGATRPRWRGAQEHHHTPERPHGRRTRSHRRRRHWRRSVSSGGTGVRRRNSLGGFAASRKRSRTLRASHNDGRAPLLPHANSVDDEGAHQASAAERQVERVLEDVHGDAHVVAGQLRARRGP